MVLNVADDHTDWHGSFAAYRDAKNKALTALEADFVVPASPEACPCLGATTGGSAHSGRSA